MLLDCLQTQLHSRHGWIWAFRIIKANKPRRIVDFGCGSGAIIVSLLHAFPAAQGVAVDPSTAAIALTKENAIRCGVRDRLAAYQCTAKDFAKTSKEDSFDLIVSNPPYIPSHEISTLQQEVKDFEDHGALDGGSDGLDIVAEILRAASAIGAPGARIYLEVHHTHPAVFEAPDSVCLSIWKMHLSNQASAREIEVQQSH